MTSAQVRSRGVRWAGALLLVFLSAASTFAIGEYFLLPRLPALMLGKWHVVDGPYEGSTVQFFADGSMASALKAKDTTETIHGTVRVNGLQLWVTTRNSLTGKETIDVLTVLDLSAQQLVTQDENGEILIMRRIP